MTKFGKNIYPSKIYIQVTFFFLSQCSVVNRGRSPTTASSLSAGSLMCCSYSAVNVYAMCRFQGLLVSRKQIGLLFSDHGSSGLIDVQ